MLQRHHLTLALAALALLSSVADAAPVPVTNTNDAFAGSLRQAIQDASPGDTIVFQIPTTDSRYDAATRVFTIPVKSDQLTIAKDLTIDGGGQKITVQRADGGGTLRVFNITGGTVTLADLTIDNVAAQIATNVENAGNLTIRGCTIRGASGGGGLLNIGTAAVINCTVAGNLGNNNFGGIFNSGDLTVRNSTIAGNGRTNTAPGHGYGIFNDGGTARLGSTIVIGNNLPTSAQQPPRDVSGAFISEGYNLIGDSTGGSGFTSTGDQVGAKPEQAGLGELRDNGGPTATMWPAPGGLAVDQGKRGQDTAGASTAIDQRGSSRPVDQPGIQNAVAGDGSDIGAVEAGLPQQGPVFTVTTISDHFAGGCTEDDCTLREAIIAAGETAGANTIRFRPGVTGTIGLVQPYLVSGVQGPLVVEGPGARLLSISGRELYRHFQTDATLQISGITFEKGDTRPSQGVGGSFLIYGSADVTLTDCAVTKNRSSGWGGAFVIDTAAKLTLTRCTVSDNWATEVGPSEALGGGIYNRGTLVATNCTFSYNLALNGGAIISRANDGVTRTTLRNCTIVFNHALDKRTEAGAGGGGYYAEGGPQQVHLSNTIIQGNTSGGVNRDVRGNYTSDGHNFIGNVGDSTGLADGTNGDQVGTAAAPKNALIDLLKDNGGPTDTHALTSNSTAINTGDDALAPPFDQRGFQRNGVSDIGAFEFGGTLPTPTPAPSATPLPSPTPVPNRFANIATRLRVETGDNVLIGGFIISGSQPKRLIVRAIGPSLPGVSGALANPQLEIYRGEELVATNDNWRDALNQQEIIDSTVAPSDDAESAVLITLPPAAYTAIVSGVGGQTGVGSVEAYDLDANADSAFANISTRGFVQTGDDVMIGGLIITGSAQRRVILRAIAPSLGIAGQLEDPVLELFDGNGNPMAANDNWKDNQQSEIEATTIPPSSDLESAIVTSLPPGAYTAVVRGMNDTTGIALVEAYAL